MIIRKTNTEVITPTVHNRSKQQWEFQAITRNLLKAREKPCAQSGIGFSFASRCLKNWREFLSQSLSAAIAMA